MTLSFTVFFLRIVFEHFNLFKGMENSIKVAVPATVLSLYFSALTAFALAMYNFKGNKLIFTVILIFMMIPGQLGLIGFYNLCSALKLINSYVPLIIPAIAARLFCPPDKSKGDLS